MSIMLPDDIGFFPREANSSGANTASLKNRLGWLREWEQAQWKLGTLPARTGNHPIHESSVLNQSSPQGHGPTEPRPGQTNTELQNNQTTSQNMRTSGNLLARQVSHGAATGMIAPLSGPYADSGLFGPSLLLTRVLPALNHSPGAGTSPLSTWNAEPYIEWRPYLMHFMQSAGGIRVWIRDKQLTGFSMLEIAASIRNELSLRGINLLSLTVNGKELWVSTPLEDAESESFMPDTATTINRTY